MRQVAQTTKSAASAALSFDPVSSVMPKQCQQQNDRQRHSNQPKQSTSSKAHEFLLLMHCQHDAGERKKFRAS